MKKRLLVQTIVIFSISLLIGMGLTPIASSNKIIEKNQTNDLLVNPSVLKIDNIKTSSLNEKELNLLKNYISSILPLSKTSNTIIDQIINLIKNMIKVKPSLLRKTIVISQGWSYDTNFFKNTRLQIKRDILSFWHYAQASKNGVECYTIVLRPTNLLSSTTAELYRGNQIGFMIRPIGLYLFQKNTFPIQSYTLFIGFASNVFIKADEQVQL